MMIPSCCIRFSPNSLSDLCHILTNELVNRGSEAAIRGISVMTRAIRKLQQVATSLTPVHSDLAKLCLVSKCFSPALPFLDTDINIICKENGQFDAIYLLLYYYYGGCIYTALKNFDRALFFFEVKILKHRETLVSSVLDVQVCVTTPTAAVSHIMLEAYKKYLLVGLLVHGDKPKASKVINSTPTRPQTLNQPFCIFRITWPCPSTRLLLLANFSSLCAPHTTRSSTPTHPTTPPS